MNIAQSPITIRYVYLMRYQLFHIWGPIAIHSYGVFIALGLIIFTFFVSHDRRFKKLHLSRHFFSIICVGTVAAFLGGKILYCISEDDHFSSYTDLLYFWQGGLSVMGSFLGIFLLLPCYLYYCNVAIVPFFDLISIYGGILQGVSRIGCFLAGCCFGKPTSVPWAVTYTDPLCAAPMNTFIHPTQLYSAACLLFIFLLMKYKLQYVFTHKGQLSGVYVMLVCLERFAIDFYRDDRILVTSFLSYNQYVALGLFGVACVFFMYCSHNVSRKRYI